MRCLLLLGISLGLASRSDGAEWRFLPGDAFFRAALTKELVDGIAVSGDSNVLEMKYDTGRVDRECLGYGVIQMSDFTRSRQENLRALYENIRATVPPVFEITASDRGEVRRELNGLPVLIYNQAFDWKNYCIGLRYNESWESDGVLFGYPKEWVNYYMKDGPIADCIIEDWRNSSRVAPLKVRFPELANLRPRDLQLSPLKVSAKDTLVIVVPEQALPDHQRGARSSFFYEVQEDRVVVHSKDQGEWSVHEVELRKQAR